MVASANVIRDLVRIVLWSGRDLVKRLFYVLIGLTPTTTAKEIDVIARTTKLMVDASETVMGQGYACRVDADIVRYPDRYMDERGEVMFSRVMTLLDMLRAKERPKPAHS